jgi:hypothetical protein
VPAAPAPAPAADPLGGALALGRTDYERLAGQVLRYGLDGLPAPPTAAHAGGEGTDDARAWPDPSRRLQLGWKALDLGDPS